MTGTGCRYLFHDGIAVEMLLNGPEDGAVELLEVCDLQEAYQFHHVGEVIPPVPDLQIFRQKPKQNITRIELTKKLHQDERKSPFA